MENKYLPEQEKTAKPVEKHYKELESVSTSSLIENFINNSDEEDIKRINEKVEAEIKEVNSKQNNETENDSSVSQDNKISSTDNSILTVNILFFILTIISLIVQTFNNNPIVLAVSGILLLSLVVSSIITACTCTNQSYKTIGMIITLLCLIFFIYFCAVIIGHMVGEFLSGCGSMLRGCE
jgi:uncharacterized membrane protein